MLSRRLSVQNDKGMAVLELVPTLFVYMLLINFSLGFFGIVHSGILHSIAARNYTFETFAHKTNLVYHIRPKPGSDLTRNNFKAQGYRYSGIISESAKTSDSFIATDRPIAFTSQFGGTDNDGVDLGGRNPGNVTGESAAHNTGVRNLNEAVRNETIAVKSIWIKTIYGICMNSKCGDP
jgi:hypothetical protein